MPVDFIHIVIGFLFVTLWAVISQFALGHNSRQDRSQNPPHSSPTPPPHRAKLHSIARVRERL